VSPIDLTDSDKTSYLGNLWLVARADKALSEPERTIIEQVRKNIEAKRSLNAAAQKSVESNTFFLTKVGSFADQVQNLEDMISVALADSDLAQAEADVIASFCGLIGIHQEQLDLVTSEVSKRLKSERSTIVCAKCGAQIQSDARFCPACGVAVQPGKPETVALDFDIPKQGYSIAFCESSAVGFPAALELAKHLGGLQTALKNKKTWYLVTVPRHRFLDAMRMAKALSGIRNRFEYIEKGAHVYGKA
jgi:Tellurite resistance protein TerB.